MSHASPIEDPLDFPSYAFVSQKLEKRPRSQGGQGLFAVTAIAKHDVLTVMGGIIVNRAQLNQLPASYMSRTIQIEEDLFQVSIRQDEPADYVNHSCDPNAGIQGQVVLVAMRDIEANEEITYDYAMSDGSAFDTFACACGSGLCRLNITGEDWRNPSLWTRYEGYFSFYLARRIEALKNT